jgi:hypothetical protein
LASVDFFTVPTATFRVLFVFVVLSHDRRRIAHLNVTVHPTSAWTAQQLREGWPRNSAPRHVIRDRDAVYGWDVRRTADAVGLDEVLTAPRGTRTRRSLERRRRRAMVGSLPSRTSAVCTTTTNAAPPDHGLAC